MKKCPRCNRELELINFSKCSSKSDGLQTYCKQCNSEYGKTRPRKTPITKHQMKIYGKRYYYGLSEDDYTNLLNSQNGRCPGCEVELEAYGRKSHIDHDHSCCSGPKSCGKCVRGILCADCNFALGRVKDSPEILQRLAGYLAL